MNVVVKPVLFLLLLSFAFSSCESEYSRTVKQELKSGVVHDDLIFGMKMGQTQKDFYDRCWQLNKQKLISEGPGNRFAKFITVLDSTVQNPEKVEMLFYGIFDEESVMHGMHMIMSYLSWSPWNDDYNSDVLVEKLKLKYLQDYPGNSFIEIDVRDSIKAYTKVDGNRRILMYPNTKKDVTVKIEDLRQAHFSTE